MSSYQLFSKQIQHVTTHIVFISMFHPQLFIIQVYPDALSTVNLNALYAWDI